MTGTPDSDREPSYAEIAAFFETAFLFLSRVFLEPPDREFLERTASEELLDDWPLPANCDAAVGLAMMKNGLAAAAADGWKDLAADYVDLFAGGRLLAPPFESVYRGEDRLMFEDATFEVREIYRGHGLEVPDKNTVPDDHIGFELLFLAWLCGRADGGAADFLTEHLLLWAGRFAKAVIDHASTSFYRGAAHLMNGTIRLLARSLGLHDPHIT
jgi:putative dimethyl sulfoxide reductase chaperone